MKVDKEITDVFGPVISSYTRADAIADGVLCDVSEVAKELFKFPVAITTAVHAILDPSDAEKKYGQDYTGRLWDTLWMLKLAIRKVGGDQVNYSVIYYLDRTAIWYKGARPCPDASDRHIELELKALCHGGDNGEPVITIMLPNED